MIFGQAPIIVPAVLGRSIPVDRFFVRLAILHASVAMRVAGDLFDDIARYRSWGVLQRACIVAVRRRGRWIGTTRPASADSRAAAS